MDSATRMKVDSLQRRADYLGIPLEELDEYRKLQRGISLCIIIYYKFIKATINFEINCLAESNMKFQLLCYTAQ